jgi:hypothetical protein
MKIPSTQSPIAQRRDPATVPVDRLFSEKQPPGSISETLKDVYYTKPENSKLLSSVTEQNQAKYEAVLEQAVAEGVLTPEQAKQREATFDSGAVGPYYPKPKSNGSKTLDILNELDADQFFLIRNPQQCGDGLYRNKDFYVSPGHLLLHGTAQGWEMSQTSDGTEVPVADVVVVGAGPGGLSTSWQLARRGGRVVCFESELAGSNFNDGGAKAVHHMRTSSDLTNIVNEGPSWGSLEHPLSLPGNLGIIRPHAMAGREGQTSLTGETMHGIPVESTDPQDRNAPATRGELWEHLSEVAESLAMDFPNAVLCERSPVQNVTYEDGLFTVTTTRGHKVKCKELVLSTGLTGPRGEQARSLKVLDDLANSAPDGTVVLQKIGDTQSRTADLHDLAKGKKKATLIVNDRLLGDQSFRQTYANLPSGSRAAIVGSGESAIKGALELAYLNPDVKVDLFVKGYLESAQVQVPSENFAAPVVENTLDDPVRTKALAEMYKVFDTPVTPRSLQEIFELQQQGRLRLVELGAYFDENSVSLTPQADGSTRLDLKDPKVRETVTRAEADYKAKGLMAESDTGPDGAVTNTVTGGVVYNAIIQAAGYHKLKLEDHPLAQLPEEAQPKIHANTISNSLHPAQSALPGLGAGGRHLAEKLAQRLVPEERKIELVPHKPGFDPRTVPIDVVDGFIRNGGISPAFVDHVKQQIAETGSSPQAAYLTFPSVDNRFRELHNTPPEQLTSAEKEVLERGRHLQKRLKEAAVEIYKPLHGGS